MNEQNKNRLANVVSRWDRERALLESAEDAKSREARFCANVERVFSTVLPPVVEEIRAELKTSGHDCHYEQSAPQGSPRFDVRLIVQGRRGSKDLVQFIVRKRDEGKMALLVELVLRSSPYELRAFENPDELTAAIAEHLLVDAVEQIMMSPPT